MSETQPGTTPLDPGGLLNSAVRDLGRGSLAEARQKLTSAAEAYRLASDELGLAMALYNLGVVAFRSANQAAAASHFAAAVESFSKTQWSVGTALATMDQKHLTTHASTSADVPVSTARGE